MKTKKRKSRPRKNRAANGKARQVKRPAENLPVEILDFSEEEMTGVDMNNEKLGIEAEEEGEQKSVKVKRKAAAKKGRSSLNSAESAKVTNQENNIVNKPD